MPERPNRVSAILAAAGLSSRMGRPKPLLPWRGATLVESQIRALLDGGADEVVVVLGSRADEIAPYAESAGGKVALNPDYESGRASSIRAGLGAISPDAAHILILGVDQPRTAAIVASVVESHLSSDAPITSPRVGGRGGHPLIFSARLLPELRRISERRQGLREVFERHRAEINAVRLNDPMARLDLNTPQAYERAYEQYGRL